MPTALPPPLAWLEGFIHSIEGALGSRVKYNIETTNIPLVFRLWVKFPEKISGKNKMLVWNLLQMYATRNDSVAAGKASNEDFKLTVELVIKRRLGPVRMQHPLE